MKGKTLKRLERLIQLPLRFHHQDIHIELAKLHAKLDTLMKEVREQRKEKE